MRSPLVTRWLQVSTAPPCRPLPLILPVQPSCQHCAHQQVIGPHPGASNNVAIARTHEVAYAITHDAGIMARDVHELTVESVAYSGCSHFGPDLSLRSTADVAHWIDEPAAFRAGMTVIHEVAASLIDAVASALTAGAPLEFAA